MRHNHCPEHRTFPPTKGIPKTITEWEYASKLSGNGRPPKHKKLLKKIHKRRSRHFLKKNIENDYC